MVALVINRPLMASPIGFGSAFSNRPSAASRSTQGMASKNEIRRALKVRKKLSRVTLPTLGSISPRVRHILGRKSSISRAITSTNSTLAGFLTRLPCIHCNTLRHSLLSTRTGSKDQASISMARSIGLAFGVHSRLRSSNSA